MLTKFACCLGYVQLQQGPGGASPTRGILLECNFLLHLVEKSSKLAAVGIPFLETLPLYPDWQDCIAQERS